MTSYTHKLCSITTFRHARCAIGHHLRLRHRRIRRHPRTKLPMPALRTRSRVPPSLFPDFCAHALIPSHDSRGHRLSARYRGRARARLVSPSSWPVLHLARRTARRTPAGHHRALLYRTPSRLRYLGDHDGWRRSVAFQSRLVLHRIRHRRPPNIWPRCTSECCILGGGRVELIHTDEQGGCRSKKGVQEGMG